MNLILTLDKNNIKINGGSYLKNSFKIIELKQVSLEKLQSINYDYVYLFTFGEFEINNNLPTCQNNDYGIFCISKKRFPAFFCLKKSFFEIFYIMLGSSIITKTCETLDIKNYFCCKTDNEVIYKITKFSDFVSMTFNSSSDFVPVEITGLKAENLSFKLFNIFSMLEFCDKSIYDSCFELAMNSLNNYQKKFLEDNLYNMTTSTYFISKNCSEKIKKFLKDNPYEIPEDYYGPDKKKYDEDYKNNFIYGDKSDLE